MVKKTLIFSLYVCSVYLFLLLFHGRAVSSELHHTRIAEGNISHVVNAIWGHGLSGYITAIKADASDWGRVRPLHWVFHSGAFLLTMIKNGDLFESDANVAWHDKINGDLQTHTAYLLFCMTLSLSFIGWVLMRLCRQRWCLALFPMVFMLGVRYLNENLKVNFCDSGEIGQLLFISSYLFLMWPMLRGAVPGLKREMLGSVMLFLAFCMKETTIVLLPVAVSWLVWLLLPFHERSKQLLRFAIRHICVYVLFSSALLGAVYYFKSGAYVSQNYHASSSITGNAIASWKLMTDYTPTVGYLLVSCVVWISLWFVERMTRKEIVLNYKDGIGIVIWGIGLMAGFWVVNIPWAFQLTKYYLPVYFFASVAVTVLCVQSVRAFFSLGLRPAGVFWCIGSLFFLLQPLAGAREASRGYYRNNYEYRKTVPRAVEDIVSLSVGEDEITTVGLITGSYFQERELPFCRWLNHEYSVNIARNGEVVQHIDACERNYFRIYADQPTFDVRAYSELPEALNDDYVYVWQGVLADEKTEMQERGYQMIREWSVGSPGTHVGVFQKK